MNKSDALAFSALFKEAYLKCFRQALENPLSETESKLFCNQVLDQTGLSVGWKSVKNYSFFIIRGSNSKSENPSAATLDTLARYVLVAPYTTELNRKNYESHYPYWFFYKEQFNKLHKKAPVKRWLPALSVFGGAAGIIFLLIYINYMRTRGPAQFSNDFKSVSTASLAKNGWFVKNPDSMYWNKRGEYPGTLTLYTLKGDNWPDPANTPGIKNLLLRSIPYDCFTAEVHLHNFIPRQEWQQAGILLLEDTLLTGKSIRLSIAYNDFFGGYPNKPKEILIQAITSLGNGFGKPEEIAHQPVMFTDSMAHNPALIKNLQNSALRIEKHGHKFRFLYAGGASGNTAFKEVATQEFAMQPRYIGIFAIKGFVGSSANIPAHFTFFKIGSEPCGQ